MRRITDSYFEMSLRAECFLGVESCDEELHQFRGALWMSPKSPSGKLSRSVWARTPNAYDSAAAEANRARAARVP
jgi:hypothetical protein